MEPVPGPVPPATPPVPPPAPPPPPVPPPATPPATPPADEYGFGGFVKKFDWVEIGFMVLGAYTMYCIVSYYRRKAEQDKKQTATVEEIAARVEEHQRNFDGMKKRAAAQRRY